MNNFSKATRSSASFTKFRAGISLIETLVAFSLLASVLGVVTPLIVQQSRLQADQRAYRLAVEGLTNQIDRLTLMPIATARGEIDKLLPPSGPTFDGAKVLGEIVEDSIGHRLTLELQWPEAVRRKPAITLVGWFVLDQENIP